MRCGHPDACWCDDDDDPRCLWCEDVERLTGHVKALREQLHRQAVIVTNGTATIEGDVGLLEIVGGNVSIHAKSFGKTLNNAVDTIPLGTPTINLVSVVPSPPPPTTP